MSNGSDMVVAEAGGEIVQWGGVDLAAAREQAEEVGASDGGEFLKLSVGKNVVRFLPPVAGQRTCFVIVHEHYIDAPGAKGPMVSACPRMMAKQPCVVCSRVSELNASGNPADRDAAYRMRAQKRIYSNVIDRKRPEMGPVILGYGKQIFDQLMGILEDEDAGGDFTNPTEGGCDIVIERVGTGKDDTKYTVRCSRKNSPLGDMAWIAHQQDIMAKVGQAKASEELQKYLRGEGGSTSSGSGGNRPGASRGFGARSPAAAPPPRASVAADARGNRSGFAPGFDDD